MSRYAVYVLPEEFRRIKRLPGHVRQRVTHAIDELAEDPRPTQSEKLDVPDQDHCTLDMSYRRCGVPVSVSGHPLSGSLLWTDLRFVPHC